MESLTFRKERALRVLEALLSGDPIERPADGWNQDELLQLSAAAILVASQDTPINTKGSFEYLEAKAQTSFDDCFTVLEFYTDLIVMAQQSLFADHTDYDEQFESVVKAELIREGDERGIRIVSGNRR